MALILPADSTEFIDLTEVKQHVNIDDNSHDEELRLMMAAAQEAVESLVGPVLQRVVVQTVVPTRAGNVLLRHAPLVSVDSVTPVAGGSAPAYTADLGAGVLTGLFTYGSPVTVSYTVGRSPVPDSIRLAALIIAKHMWKTQLGTAPSLLGEESEVASGMGYGIPNRAMDLLRPYLQSSQVA